MKYIISIFWISTLLQLVGFNFKILCKPVVDILLNFPKSVRGVTLDEKFKSQQAFKVKFQILRKNNYFLYMRGKKKEKTRNPVWKCLKT